MVLILASHAKAQGRKVFCRIWMGGSHAKAQGRKVFCRVWMGGVEMAWTTPVTRTTGTFITAALWNVAVVNNIRFQGVTHDHSGDAGDGVTLFSIPAGMIAMFDAACPAGWTHVAAVDDKFPRGASSYGGTGGADTHSHTGPSHQHSFAEHGHTASSHTHTGPSHAHSQTDAGGVVGNTGDLLVAENKTGAAMQLHAGGGASTWPGMTSGAAAGGTGATGGHSADVTNAAATDVAAETGTTGSASTLPVWVGVVFCKKN